MQIEVNGVQKEIASETRLSELLTQLNLAPERVAVERNFTIVDRTKYDLPLKDGDKIEIIHFVGGGCADGRSDKQRPLGAVNVTTPVIAPDPKL